MEQAATGQETMEQRAAERPAAQGVAQGAAAAAPSRLRILIAGAGIAGSTAAFWLARLGHECTVVERHEGLRTNGLQIDIEGAAIEVAERMDMLDELRRRRVDEEGTQFVDAQGRVQAYFGRGPPGKTRSLTKEYEIMRGDLAKLLYERSEGRVRYRFGLSVDDYEEEAGGVRVRLSDGASESYDLLVGADGQGSRIRRKMAAEGGGGGSDADSYRRLDAFCCYFTVPGGGDGGGGDWAQEKQQKKLATVCHVPGRRVMMTRQHRATVGQAYLSTMSHGEELREALGQGVGAQKAAFARVFGDAGWRTRQLLGAMARASDFYAQELVQVTTGRWRRGRVVLVGDAGYAPSPFSGAGTTLAMVGAYVLAGELGRAAAAGGGADGADAKEADADAVGAALDAYETRLRPLVQQMQRLPRGFPAAAFPSTGLGVRALHWAVWLMSGLLQGAQLLRVPDAVDAVGGRRAWRLPAYPELDAMRPGEGEGEGEAP